MKVRALEKLVNVTWGIKPKTKQQVFPSSFFEFYCIDRILRSVMTKPASENFNTWTDYRILTSIYISEPRRKNRLNAKWFSGLREITSFALILTPGKRNRLSYFTRLEGLSSSWADFPSTARDFGGYGFSWRPNRIELCMIYTCVQTLL